MIVTSEADEAWWPPTLSPSGLGRTWFALWIVQGLLALVFGASGYIGTHLVPRLLAAGKRVRASARNVEVLLAEVLNGSLVRLFIDHPPIVAVNANASNPHYEPTADNHAEKSEREEQSTDGQVMFETHVHLRSFLLRRITPTMATRSSTEFFPAFPASSARALISAAPVTSFSPASVMTSPGASFASVCPRRCSTTSACAFRCGGRARPRRRPARSCCCVFPKRTTSVGRRSRWTGAGCSVDRPGGMRLVS